ncbi:MAG: 7-cyano-7-deazaguanine synthase QueC [Candidatus Brocadiales bacterium]|nr:7-cyano-7-deazaguanine synthase QueC [Candidatus Brocadiales bacterium]
MRENLAVVLLSGGMDSCVTAAIAREFYELALLHANYRQRTESRELKAFNDIATYYGVPKERRLIIDMGYLGALGGSSLTDKNIEVPQTVHSEASERQAELPVRGIPSTYVPFRNTHLLMTAVSWAEVIGAEKVFIGAVEEDSPGYPDCRVLYYKVFNKLVEVGTKPQTRITVETPLIQLKKWEIVKRGISLGAPFHLSWSCYQREDKACGLCHSCVQRLKAFSEAGYKDPIPYEELKSLRA